MINHIADNYGMNCECRLCAYEENGTFLEGLVEALKLIKR